jgi:large subunit ribosomal protein L29
MIKTKDLHAMTMPDLLKRLKDSRQELFNLRFQMATGQLANHRQIRNVRRALAQILTELQEKEEQGTQVEEVAAPEPAAPRRRSRPAAAAAVAEIQAEAEPGAEAKPRRVARRTKPASRPAPSEGLSGEESAE